MSRSRSARLVGALVLLALAGPASALAARPAKLQVRSVSNPPASLKAGQRFVTKTVVANRGGHKSRAQVGFTLASDDVSYAVGAKAVKTLRPGHRATVRTTLELPSAILAEGGRYSLVACVTTKRGGIARCRKATKRTSLKQTALSAPSVTATPTPVPSTGPATPAPGGSADKVPPFTGDSVPDGYANAAVPVTLTAVDSGGGTVAATFYTVGADPATPTSASAKYDAAAKPVLADGQRIRYFSIDDSGNAEEVRTSRAAKIDAIAPATTNDVPATYRSAPVVVTLTAADTGGSGVARIYFTKGVSPAMPTALSSVYDPDDKPVLLNNESIRYFAVDGAGNAEAVKTSPPAQVNGSGPVTTDNVPTTYQPSNVAVILSATAPSGIARTYYTTGTNPAAPTTSSAQYDPANEPTLGDGERIRYFSTDNAGNAEAVKTSAAAKVDGAAPTTIDNVPSTYQTAAVTVTLTATDVGSSGLKEIHYVVGTSFATPTTTSSVYDPNDKPKLLDGQRIRYFAIDNAGNAEPVKSSAAAKVDLAGPVTTDNVPNTYQPGPVSVTLTATAVSGIAKTYYEIGATPATPTTASPVYDPANKPVLANGQAIAYFSTSTAGASEAVKTSAAAKVDQTAPTTTDNVPATYSKTVVTVTLTATDAASGVSAIYYTKGVSPEVPTTSSAKYDATAKPTLANGESIRYFAVDAAGNAMAPKTSAAAKVDLAGPTTSDNVGTGYVNTATAAVTLTTSSLSGVVKTYYEIGTTPATPTTASPAYDPLLKPVLADGQRISYFSVDNAGNVEPVRTSLPLKVDAVAPTTTDSVPTGGYTNQPIRVTLTATDALSGPSKTYYVISTVNTVPAPTTASPVYDPNNKPTLYVGEAIRYYTVDAAGNAETSHTSAKARIDTIAPISTDDVPSSPVSDPVPVTLLATDTGGANLSLIRYTIGTAPAAPTVSSPLYNPNSKPTLTNGQKIRYAAVDTAGNTETSHTSVAAVVSPTAYVSGARTLKDTLFPTIGNGGFDAQNYNLDLSYDIASKVLSGTATDSLKATQNLSDFSLDLVTYLTVSSVTVDGTPAQFRQQAGDNKLVITPASGIAKGSSFSVVVTYAGTEQAFIDPDGSSEGWIPSTTRGAVVTSEPVGAMGWFPNNNVPYDKATFNVTMTVPDVTSGVPWQVVASGVQNGAPTVAGGNRTYNWVDTDPTAPYLYGLGIGKYDQETSMTTPTATNPTSVPVYLAVENAFTTGKAAMLTDLRRTPAIQDYYADYYGVPYPFVSEGGIVPLVSVGYSLEVQTKPIYATSTNVASTGSGINTISHENGHMYFGDDVTLNQWRDIWLNEGMTEFTSWLWQERQNNGTTLASRYAGTSYGSSTSTSAFTIAPAAPGTAADIFNSAAMYTRGAMTMYNIMQIMGEADFRDLMNKYLTAPGHPYGNSSTEEFIALVKSHDLADQTRDGLPDRTARWTEFFRQWLYTSYSGPANNGNKPQINKDTFDTYVLP